MTKYIVKRVLFGLVTLFALATITFYLMHAIPGTPFSGEMRQLSDAIRDKLIEQYDLDKPYHVQYIKYLKNAVTGDFGTSLHRKGAQVMDIIVKLGWLPMIGLSGWKNFIMPGVALALGPIAMISRLVKSGLQEELRQDYVTLAKSKGTGEVTVVLRHALKNAILPVITYAGPLLATLVTGSFVVETMFTIPGIGAEFVNSVTNRDYTLIMALTIIYGAFIIIANIATDLISAAIDPRVRLK